MWLNLQSQIKELDLDLYLRMVRETFPQDEQPLPADMPTDAQDRHSNDAVVAISKLYLGQDDELGRSLLTSYITAILHQRAKPKALLFMHNAVTLCCHGSAVYDTLLLLRQQKVDICLCEQSLDCQVSRNTKHVGHSISATSLVAMLFNASKVIAI